MTDALLSHFKQDIEELVLVPAGGGKFELFVDGEQIHSKLDSGNFPDPKVVIKTMENHSGA